MIGVVTVWLFRFVVAEPRYEDKTLTEWLRLADDHSTGNTAAVVRAEAAIKSIGSKAVPELLGMLTAQDNFRNRSIRTWNAALEAVLPPAWAWRLKVEGPDNQKQRLLAMRGFEILSTNADMAVPQLKALLHHTNLAFHSTRILADIHTSNALAALTTGLTNASARVRLPVVQSLWFDWESNEIHQLKDQIIALHRDNDDEVAAYALKTHLKIVDAEEAARIAAKSLTDSRVQVQREALFVLLFGPEWAMEAITNCFSSTCPKNRTAATNVILSINPYRAPEFGVATNGLRNGIFRAYDMRDPREIWREN